MTIPITPYRFCGAKAALMTGGAALLLAVCPGDSHPAQAADKCARLPTVEDFTKESFDKTAVKRVQVCLGNAGLYNGRIDGIKGSLTIAALQRAVVKTIGVPTVPANKPQVPVKPIGNKKQ